MNEYHPQIFSINHQQEFDDKQILMRNYEHTQNVIHPKKLKLEGKKNPNNPREMLNKVNEVFVSKKANYIDCMTCNCCIGENVYKIYKYKYPPKEEQKSVLPQIGMQNNIQDNIKIMDQYNEGGEDERNQQQNYDDDMNSSFQIAAPQLSNYNKVQPIAMPHYDLPNPNYNQYNAQNIIENKPASQFKEIIDIGDVERNYLKPSTIINTHENINNSNAAINRNPYSNQSQSQSQSDTVIQVKQKKEKGKRILKIDEDSIMFPKIFCPASCRPYNAYAVSSNGIFEFGRLNRDFKLTFLCCERPEILVYRTEFLYKDDDQNLFETFIGKVVNPQCLGSMQVLIYESNGPSIKTKYEISGNWFSPANLCYKLGICGKVRFNIKDLQNQPTRQNRFQKQQFNQANIQPQEGKIVRQYSNFVKECFSQGTNYKIKFPENATVDQKMLILAGMMLLDFSYFDKKCCLPGFFC